MLLYSRIIILLESQKESSILFIKIFQITSKILVMANAWNAFIYLLFLQKTHWKNDSYAEGMLYSSSSSSSFVKLHIIGVSPNVVMKSKRIGGLIYQVPVETVP